MAEGSTEERHAAKAWQLVALSVLLQLHETTDDEEVFVGNVHTCCCSADVCRRARACVSFAEVVCQRRNKAADLFLDL